MSTGLVAIVMVFSIPIIKTLTNHFQKQSQLKHQIIKDELELEKLKHENFMIETQKMKLELEQMALPQSKDEIKIL
jgi:hypothetical protein